MFALNYMAIKQDGLLRVITVDIYIFRIKIKDSPDGTNILLQYQSGTNYKLFFMVIVAVMLPIIKCKTIISL